MLLPLVLAATLLLCGVLSPRLPALAAAGFEVLLLMPLLLLVTLLTLWLPTLWWPQMGEQLAHYEQRNLLVAALAMGFALVPLIFTRRKMRCLACRWRWGRARWRWARHRGKP